MFDVDITGLRGKMGERRYTITRLAEEAGISRNTMSFYFEHPEKFPYPVMQSVARSLTMSYDEAQRIFFKQKLTQTQE